MSVYAQGFKLLEQQTLPAHEEAGFFVLGGERYQYIPEARSLWKTALQVGATKNVNGVTYTLNQNHRWTKAKDSAKAAVGRIGQTVSTKVQQAKQGAQRVKQQASKVGHAVIHEGDHLGQNVVSWKTGQVIGGAIASYAIAHGANPVAATIISQSVVQAGTATALYVAQRRNKGKPANTQEIGSQFVKQVAAAYLGKYAHHGTEWALENLGVKHIHQQVGAMLAGKITGIKTGQDVARMHLDSRVTMAALGLAGNSAKLVAKHMASGGMMFKSADGLPPELADAYWKLYQLGVAIALHSQQLTKSADLNPKEGDTKPGANGNTLTLRNGRWHDKSKGDGGSAHPQPKQVLPVISADSQEADQEDLVDKVQDRLSRARENLLTSAHFSDLSSSQLDSKTIDKIYQLAGVDGEYTPEELEPVIEEFMAELEAGLEDYLHSDSDARVDKAFASQKILGSSNPREVLEWLEDVPNLRNEVRKGRRGDSIKIAADPVVQASYQAMSVRELDALSNQVDGAANPELDGKARRFLRKVYQQFAIHSYIADRAYLDRDDNLDAATMSRLRILADHAISSVGGDTNRNWKDVEDGIEAIAWELRREVSSTPDIESDDTPDKVLNLISNLAGNLKKSASGIKRVLTWWGLQIGLEKEPGDIRHGRKMKSGYGHIRGSYGDAEDGMSLDVYIGPDLGSHELFRVKQVIPETGELDEYKFIIGCWSLSEAKQLYLSHMPEKFFGGIDKVNLRSQFGKYRLRKAAKKASPGQMSLFDESKHPRDSKGKFARSEFDFDGGPLSPKEAKEVVEAAWGKLENLDPGGMSIYNASRAMKALTSEPRKKSYYKLPSQYLNSIGLMKAIIQLEDGTILHEVSPLSPEALPKTAADGRKLLKKNKKSKALYEKSKAFFDPLMFVEIAANPAGVQEEIGEMKEYLAIADQVAKGEADPEGYSGEDSIYNFGETYGYTSRKDLVQAIELYEVAIDKDTQKLIKPLSESSVDALSALLHEESGLNKSAKKASPGQLNLFDESQHPRNEKGEFVSKDKAAGGLKPKFDPDGGPLTRSQANEVIKATWGYKLEDFNKENDRSGYRRYHGRRAMAKLTSLPQKKGYYWLSDSYLESIDLMKYSNNEVVPYVPPKTPEQAKKDFIKQRPDLEPLYNKVMQSVDPVIFIELVDDPKHARENLSEMEEYLAIADRVAQGGKDPEGESGEESFFNFGQAYDHEDRDELIGFIELYKLALSKDVQKVFKGVSEKVMEDFHTATRLEEPEHKPMSKTLFRLGDTLYRLQVTQHGLTLVKAAKKASPGQMSLFDQGPKEGDTKPGAAGNTLTLRGGHWVDENKSQGTAKQPKQVLPTVNNQQQQPAQSNAQSAKPQPVESQAQPSTNKGQKSPQPTEQQPAASSVQKPVTSQPQQVSNQPNNEKYPPLNLNLKTLDADPGMDGWDGEGEEPPFTPSEGLVKLANYLKTANDPEFAYEYMSPEIVSTAELKKREREALKDVQAGKFYGVDNFGDLEDLKQDFIDSLSNSDNYSKLKAPRVPGAAELLAAFQREGLTGMGGGLAVELLTEHSLAAQKREIRDEYDDEPDVQQKLMRLVSDPAVQKAARQFKKWEPERVTSGEYEFASYAAKSLTDIQIGMHPEVRAAGRLLDNSDSDRALEWLAKQIYGE